MARAPVAYSTGTAADRSISSIADLVVRLLSGLASTRSLLDIVWVGSCNRTLLDEGRLLQKRGTKACDTPSTKRKCVRESSSAVRASVLWRALFSLGGRIFNGERIGKLGERLGE